jgi:hypothetical protein
VFKKIKNERRSKCSEKIKLKSCHVTKLTKLLLFDFTFSLQQHHLDQPQVPTPELLQVQGLLHWPTSGGKPSELPNQRNLQIIYQRATGELPNRSQASTVTLLVSKRTKRLISTFHLKFAAVQNRASEASFIFRRTGRGLYGIITNGVVCQLLS